jgi:hypothetical protein
MEHNSITIQKVFLNLVRDLGLELGVMRLDDAVINAGSR